MWTLLLLVYHANGSQTMDQIRIQTHSYNECKAKGQEFKNIFGASVYLDYLCTPVKVDC